MLDLDDEALMSAYLGGDSRAFALLYQRHAAPLFRMMRQRGVSEEDTRDLIQQTFLQLHRARGAFDPSRRVRPWLLTIAFNLMRDGLRRARRWREGPLELEVPAGDQGDPVVRAREVARVRDALEQLSPAQRRLVAMHWFEDLSYAEIADRLGATTGAIKLRSFRAHSALREALSEAA